MDHLGQTAAPGETRIHLCGRYTVRIEGRRIEEAFPGRQGRVLFAFLVVNRHRVVTRADLARALWSGNTPPAADSALSALLTRLRNALGSDLLAGKHEPRLNLPASAWVDVESATAALHRAEGAVALADWTAAWAPARVALHIAMRPFLGGHEGEWITAMQARMEQLLLRSHECVAAIGIALEGIELGSAERSARALVARAPYHESGYRLLMEVLARRGDVAEALVTYEQLRRLLRDDLGARPSASTQALHQRLLRGGSLGGPP